MLETQTILKIEKLLEQDNPFKKLISDALSTWKNSANPCNGQFGINFRSVNTELDENKKSCFKTQSEITSANCCLIGAALAHKKDMPRLGLFSNCESLYNLSSCDYDEIISIFDWKPVFIEDRYKIIKDLFLILKEDVNFEDCS